jgi:hypothetical protein
MHSFCDKAGDLPEDYRIDEKAKNPRKTIIDVLNEAVSLCSDVFLDQKNRTYALEVQNQAH